MSKSLRVFALVGLTGLCAQAALAHGPQKPPGQPWPPSGLVRVPVGGEKLMVWPYTTSDFETPSDPINLVFPNADPREIRQELMNLDGDRSLSPFAGLPFADCRWTDAMGYEQTAYHANRRGGDWTGGAVQLACVHEGAPLGDYFRFHIRLFRAGNHTIGNAHFEFLITGTAEHEVLSWDFARDFVTYDAGRTGTLVGLPGSVGVIPGGSFREVRRPVYDALFAFGGGVLRPLLASLGLEAPLDPNLNVPIPTNGKAMVLAADIDLHPARSHTVTTTQVTYDITVPKPFCAGVPAGQDFVKLEGPLDFTMSVSTGSSGRYERTYTIGGTLDVTTLPAGSSAKASIFEIHQATMDDRHEQVTERTQQSLLPSVPGDPFQSMAWSFAAGDTDRFIRNVVCGTP
jgi:hypothetical protein